MKLFSRVLLILFLPIALQANINYAVVNFQQVLSSSKAYKSFQTQVEQHRNNLEKELQKEREVIQKEEQSLIDNQKNISEVEFEKRRNTLQSKVVAFQTKFRDKQTSFERNNTEAVQTIENSLRKVIADVAKENNYDIIHIASTLAYYHPNKDISNDILKKLDAAISKITVKKP